MPDDTFHKGPTTAPVVAMARPSRTTILLNAPVLPLLFRLSAPNLAEAAARVAFLSADGIFVSWLGTPSLAAMSVVFPWLMVIQTFTASGFGAGVSASIGQSLGAGDVDRAHRLAGTAIVLTLVASAGTTVTTLMFGPRLYHAMGAELPWVSRFRTAKSCSAGSVSSGL